MRSLLILSLSSTVFLSCIAQKKQTVSIKLSFTKQYCGGARPTPEIEEEARKPRPFENRTVILMNESKVDSVKTDKNGMLKKKLKPGDYVLIESWRYYHSTPDGSPLSDFDKDCLKLEWEKPFATLKIAGRKQTFELKYELEELCRRQLPCIKEEAMGEPPQ